MADSYYKPPLKECGVQALLVQIPALVDAWGDDLKLLRALFKLFGW